MKLLLLLLAVCFLLPSSPLLAKKKKRNTHREPVEVHLATTIAPPAKWMLKQIQTDFAPYLSHTVTLEQIEKFYQENAENLLLAKFTISQNTLSAEAQFTAPHALYRLNAYKKAVQKLLHISPLPNMTFLITLHDGIGGTGFEEIPLLVMSKHPTTRGILIPDFEAIANRFQVLGNSDVASCEIPWEQKKTSLIWRGSSAYAAIYQTEENIPANHRIKLCELSLNNPDRINARITLFDQGAKEIPSLQRYKGEFVSFNDQFFYKYHILIDGNALPYSASGWKFFTNSLLFKPSSPWIQWYTTDLQPWVHYVPLERDLKDLLPMLSWAESHEHQAKQIAQNARHFALTHISESSNFTYLHAVLLKYHTLFNP